MLGRIPAARQAIIDRVAAIARRKRRREMPVAPDRLARCFYHGVSELDLVQRSPEDLAGAALAQLELGRVRTRGQSKVRVFNPEPGRDGFASPHTVIMVVTDDMPFLVDSLGMVCTQRGLAVHLLAHPVLSVVRDGRGLLKSVHLDDAPQDAGPESWQMIEIDREPDASRLAAIEASIRSSLDDVRAATSDWRRMRTKAREAAATLGGGRSDVREAKALLEWMEGDHFTFLGYREYRLRRGPRQDRLMPVPRSGLGILRPRAGHKAKTIVLSGEIREFARSTDPLIITKANSVATVHRSTYLDYVGVKTFDAKGNVTGERRFLGLWTSSAYSHGPSEIPVLRHKVQRVIDHFHLKPSSHDHKALVHALDTFPRDELFQATLPDLVRIVRGIVNLYERAQVRLFVRRDPFRRFYSCLIYVPRDRYNTQARKRIEKLSLEAFGGVAIESQVTLSESVLARLHLLVRTPTGADQGVEAVELERRIAQTVRTWQDQLKDALLDSRGEAEALQLFRTWGDAFPAAYQEDMPFEAAVDDIALLEQVAARPGELHMSMYRREDQPRHKVQFKLLRKERPIPISDVLPTIENLGLKLISERPYDVGTGPGAFWIQDFELEHPRGVTIDLATDGPRFMTTFTKVWAGEADNDGFNRLVLAANLGWREATVLRTYARWFGQIGLPLSQSYIEEALASNAAAACNLLRLFIARFDPSLTVREQRRAQSTHRRALERQLAGVKRIDDDRILRIFLAAIEATLRTNYFVIDAAGSPRPYLALKLDARRMQEVPLPRPMFEIFVHSPRVEGVHLRMGFVARGGLRWSDRREDFRTEILGLMKAQHVKNTVIVPVGAKGGFVPRRPPAGRDEAQADGTECYRWFIRALLDVTDNVVGGKVTPPACVVRHDGDDAYLVVAADKGTAKFSDVANRISAEYGFWLGDAFASGGSAGYDHKGMGITARGGWESVRRHFREFGRDTQSQHFTVAGIGDMSGDVFGNAMLLSPHIRLLAAFDHRHIFIDPAPDGAHSFAERKRLFGLARSSWEDYDRRLLSKGGGVHSRQGKSVPLSAEARGLLGLDASAAPPNDVIRAILRMPVDLLWNGGIGTYVKSADESHAEIGDRANDAVRVNGSELRCRVVGEGGNLGFSQRGRIEYAAAGGRINTDFIDNSAGVNCSDVEVNLKILLNPLTASGRLPLEDRNELLAGMTDEVARLVLRNNYLQSLAISTVQARAAERIAELGHVIHTLERGGSLDRNLEALPTADEVADRRRKGQGLTRPELSMLLSYSKIWLSSRLWETDVADDPFLGGELTRYFPEPVQRKFARELQKHQLRREIIVTAITNSLVNRMGPVFAIRMQEDTGADVGSIARAYSIAREVTGMRDLWADIEALDDKAPTAIQYDMLVETSRLLRHLSYWVLRNQGRNLDIERAVSRMQPGIRELMHDLPDLIDGTEVARYERALAHYSHAGVPPKVSRRVASLGAVHAGVDIVEIALLRRSGIGHTARAYFGLGAELGLDWLRDQIERLPVDGHWQAVARGALREELYLLQRRLSDRVLAGKTRGDAREQVTGWIAAGGEAVAGISRMVREMRATGSADFPTVSVAVRALRRLVER
ncbi:MAG TPA: NAD-glutamate dehydrogenase [Steroidobacteraceae bacterium]|nr:NAD-glutamate dehydrogenase [Steroidobacteraceae bacterium]